METNAQGIRVESLRADSDTRYANETRLLAAQDAGRSVEPCYLCGRPLTDKAADSGWWVEIGDGGSTILPNDHAHGDDTLGCFPVGSECAKRIPRTHKGR